MVYRRGLGPRHCPANQISFSIAAESISQLLKPEIKSAVKHMSLLMQQEDGAQGAADAFSHHLPLENMCCEVSLYLGISELADVYCVDCRMKMSTHVSSVVHAEKGMTEHVVRPYSEYHHSWDEALDNPTSVSVTPCTPCHVATCCHAYVEQFCTGVLSY